MVEGVLVDTDILIDAALGIEVAVSWLRDTETHDGVAISAISQMELLVGCRNKTEQKKLDRFLKRFQILQSIEESSEIAAALLRKYRLSHGLLIADALIASTAIFRGLAFATKNRRDYRFIKGLKLLPYPPR